MCTAAVLGMLVTSLDYEYGLLIVECLQAGCLCVYYCSAVLKCGWLCMVRFSLFRLLSLSLSLTPNLRCE